MIKFDFMEDKKPAAPENREDALVEDEEESLDDLEAAHQEASRLEEEKRLQELAEKAAKEVEARILAEREENREDIENQYRPKI